MMAVHATRVSESRGRVLPSNFIDKYYPFHAPLRGVPTRPPRGLPRQPESPAGGTNSRHFGGVLRTSGSGKKKKKSLKTSEMALTLVQDKTSVDITIAS
jgi:hypothetical protein